MNIKNIFYTSAIVIVIISCQHPAGNIATVKGSLNDASGFKLTLQEMDTHEIYSIDSVVLDHSGKFSFSPIVKEPGFWLLKAPTGKILVLLLNPGDKVELSGSARNLPDNIILKGPEETLLLNDFFHLTRMNERKADSLEMILAGRQDSSDYYQVTQKLDTCFRQIWESQRNIEIAFINKHPGSMASLVVLNYAFGMSPVLSPEDDYIYYQKLDSALNRKFPENKHVKFHHQRILEIKRKISVSK